MVTKTTEDKHCITQDVVQEILTRYLLQETKKCLDAGRGQSMDLLYVAPCQNIPSQVEYSLLLIVSDTCFSLSRCGTLTTISTNWEPSRPCHPLPLLAFLNHVILTRACSLSAPHVATSRTLRWRSKEMDLLVAHLDSMSLQGACNASFSLNSCDTLAKFIVDPLIVVNQ